VKTPKTVPNWQFKAHPQANLAGLGSSIYAHLTYLPWSTTLKNTRNIETYERAACPKIHLRTVTMGSVTPSAPPVGSRSHSSVPRRLYTLSEPPSLPDFERLCSQSTDSKTYPLATSVTSNIPIYNLNPHSPASPDHLNALQDEWHHILLSGPGVFILRNFLPDTSLLESVNAIFDEIIASEASTTTKKGDHFASAGSNSRIWNSFQKHALRDPSSFVRYYCNPYLAAVCQTWLGPGYQITAQANIVRPGGKPQVSHRDYHLGFQTAECSAAYPRATQMASQFLTLQGAIAHSDMPLSSGPTRFLPFSQQFDEGFMAYRLPAFQQYFDAHWVSCELKMGDAVFFNPALFHAAGENTTSDVHRSANLLQVSSAFGKTMETIGTLEITQQCWEEVTRLYAAEGGFTAKVDAVLSAIGNGYPFPTNLDNRPPAPGGMAPESEIDALRRGLSQSWDTRMVANAILRIRTDSKA
jgi:ectoine hydroxylase-related dioxygenase (phytanoyl-CoA dioxygenase family)